MKKKLSEEQEILALKRAAKYRREFLGNVSHELKTPIFNIQGYIHTLIDGALEDPNVNKKYLLRTSKSIDRLISIIEDLEILANLESDELLMDVTDWDLIDLVNELFEFFEIKSSEKNIKLSLDSNFDTFFVLADKEKINQVLVNLISNSIKYGKEGGSITIKIEKKEKNSLIHVVDDGIGISSENISRVFERFYRVDKGRSRSQGGTGLGLAIVKHIIEAHEQEIDISSQVNKGTAISFTLKNSIK
ncbi:MAG: two-component sensor histidine kinase [Crocinitomicaceae bacterium]|nr:two-component sensor histidine kinase [Crocinitomicaceae bacterium]